MKHCPLKGTDGHVLVMCVHNDPYRLLFYALLAKSALLFYHYTTDQLFALLP